MNTTVLVLSEVPSLTLAQCQAFAKPQIKDRTRRANVRNPAIVGLSMFHRTVIIKLS
jgi:hypothetical protein